MNTVAADEVLSVRLDNFLASHCVGMDDHGPDIWPAHCEKCARMKEELLRLFAEFS